MFSLDAAIPHLIVAALTAYVALDQRLARSRRRIAGVDYSRMRDAGRLNARAARCLATLPAVALANAGLAAFGRVSDVWLWGAFVLAVAVVIGCISAAVRSASRDVRRT